VTRALIHSFLGAAWGASLLWPQPRADTAIPKTWDETALADWATPLAGLNVRPTHISSKEYYSMRVDNLRIRSIFRTVSPKAIGRCFNMWARSR
jgi:hypothetical protein